MTRRSPLSDATLKIIRAHQHLDELERHVELYLKDEPHAFPAEFHGDLMIVGKARPTVPPHLDIGLIIGDCLTTAMASLDYLVWGLCERHAGRPLVPPPIGQDKPSFPLFTDPKRFQRSKALGDLRTNYKVPTDRLAGVERVQPYNAGYEPLSLLYLLVNQDKHRFPLLMIQEIDTDEMSVTYGGEAVSVVQSMASMVAFKTPAEMISAGFDPAKMDVKAKLTRFVAFDDPTMPREGVEITLEKILLCVQRVHGEFAPFFA